MYDLAIEKDELIKELPDELIKDLVWFITRYSDKLNPRSVEHQIYNLQGVDEKEKKKFLNGLVDIAQKTWEKIFAEANPIFKVISAFLKIQRTTKNPLLKIKHSPLNLMKRFADIAQEFKINHIYIQHFG